MLNAVIKCFTPKKTNNSFKVIYTTLQLGQSAVIVEPFALEGSTNTEKNSSIIEDDASDEVVCSEVEGAKSITSHTPICPDKANVDDVLQNKYKGYTQFIDSIDFGGYVTKFLYKNVSAEEVYLNVVRFGGDSWWDFSIITLHQNYGLGMFFAAEWLLLLWVFIVSRRIYKTCLRLLSHSRSKSLFFTGYRFAAGCIFAQSFLIITSNTDKEMHDGGILLIYIYTTAVLMLFLIFLALTTCESYLKVETLTEDIKNDRKKLVPLMFLVATCFAFLWYKQYLAMELRYLLSLKQEITAIIAEEFLANNASNNYKNEVMATNVTGVPFQPYTGVYTDHVQFSAKTSFENTSTNHKSSSSWSIFDSLKFDIIDTKYQYIQSALLQFCALLIVILSIVL